MPTKKIASTVVDSNGLRFVSKSAGSPFISTANPFSKPTRSCFRCGQHRPQSELEHKRVLGASRAVCLGGCNKS